MIPQEWINLSDPEQETQDHHPCIASDPLGHAFVVWSAFLRTSERIYGCFLQNGKMIKRYVIYEHVEGCGAPYVSARGDGRFDVVFVSVDQGKNKMMHTVADATFFHEPVVADCDDTLMHPTVRLDPSSNDPMITYTAMNEQGCAIRCAYSEGTRFRDPVILSEPSHACMRAVQVKLGVHRTLVVWDAYVKHEGFTIRGVILENQTVVQRLVLSDTDLWQLHPAAVADGRGGAYVAYLAVEDVINSQNVIDQHNSIRVVHVSDQGEIKYLRDGDRKEVADLSWGLMPKEQVWGYLGRRRHPMLMMTQNGNLLCMWERKTEWSEGTRAVSGTLCVRVWDGYGWGKPMRLHEGKRLYAPDTSAACLEDRIWMAARENHAVSHTQTVAAQIKCAYGALPSGTCEGFSRVEWSCWDKKTAMKKHVTIDGIDYHLFWGDLHVHSALSADAEGEPDELAMYARDKTRIDFCAFSENDEYCLALTDYEYHLHKAFAKSFTENGKMVFIPGFEWTCVEEDGTLNHRTVLVPDTKAPLIRYTDQPGDRMERLDRYAKRFGAILHPHHANWALYDRLADVPNVEACSGWARYIEQSDQIEKHWRNNRVFGLIGGSDSHRRTPGAGGALTGVYAKELTLESLFEALRARRCFATDGNRCILRLWVEDAFMGQILTMDTAPKIRMMVDTPEQLNKVILIRDGQPIFSFEAKGHRFERTVCDHTVSPGMHTYRLKVEQHVPWEEKKSNIAPYKGPLAWSSPVFVRCIHE